MIKALIGMLKWKRSMKKYANMSPYTDEWWNAMSDSLAFLPEEQRKGMLDIIVMMGTAL